MLEEQGSALVTKELKWLAMGPRETVKTYSGYLINGYRFHTKQREKYLKTQNSGVVVLARASSYATTRDNNPVEGEMNYYGVLKEIIQLNYSGMLEFVLFKCDWVNNYM